MDRTVWAYARDGVVPGLRSLLSNPDAEVHRDELDDFGVTPLMVRAEKIKFSPRCSPAKKLVLTFRVRCRSRSTAAPG